MSRVLSFRDTKERSAVEFESRECGWIIFLAFGSGVLAGLGVLTTAELYKRSIIPIATLK